MRLTLGYPSVEEEADIYLRFEKDSTPPPIEAVTDGDEIRRVQDMTPTVRVEEPVRDYIVAVVRGTRDHPGMSLGASPRAGMALYKATQAWAAIDGRDFVTPGRREGHGPRRPSPTAPCSARPRGCGETLPSRWWDDVLSSVSVPIEG